MSDHLLPPSSTPSERAMAKTGALISAVPTPARDLWNPDTCPIELLPWLAWAWSVDDWDDSWSEAQKRATVKASRSIHMHKGTIGSVKDALLALGLTVQVQEWFNQIPAGAPYTYRLLLEVNQFGISLEQLHKIESVVANAKNLRSHMADMTMTVKSASSVYMAATSLSGHDIEFSVAAGGLVLDGSWTLDGSEELDGIRNRASPVATALILDG